MNPKNLEHLMENKEQFVKQWTKDLKAVCDENELLYFKVLKNIKDLEVAISVISVTKNLNRLDSLKELHKEVFCRKIERYLEEHLNKKEPSVLELWNSTYDYLLFNFKGVDRDLRYELSFELTLAHLDELKNVFSQKK